MNKHNSPDEKHEDSPDLNRDPISGTPGAHPLGTGAGALAGAASGAAIGTMVGGPVGMAVGGVAGAVVGGLTGKGVAEAVNPTVEDAYWRDNYSKRPYVAEGDAYDLHQPAYRYGWESRSKQPGKKWDEVESDLGNGWDKARGTSPMEWEDAKSATHDAWDRLDEDDTLMNEDGMKQMNEPRDR